MKTKMYIGNAGCREYRLACPYTETGAGHACRCERQVGLRTQSILILARVGHIAVNNVKI